MTSAQLARAGGIAGNYPDGRWFVSYFAEEGDLCLYLQNLITDDLWKIEPDGRSECVSNGSAS